MGRQKWRDEHVTSAICIPFVGTAVQSSTKVHTSKAWEVRIAHLSTLHDKIQTISDTIGLSASQQP
jgi:hypothetical protein